MKHEYLGDSYDLVKRFWAQTLGSIAPLYAHPKFIPDSIRAEYTRVTTIPILDLSLERHNVPIGLLMDPDTGIPLPSEPSRVVKISHSSLDFIIQILIDLSPEYLVSFDQSHKREKDFSKEMQRSMKLDYLAKRGFPAFYYVSHAPFLFAFKDKKSCDSVLVCLSAAGLPTRRLEGGTIQSSRT